MKKSFTIDCRIHPLSHCVSLHLLEDGFSFNVENILTSVCSVSRLIDDKFRHNKVEADLRVEKTYLKLTSINK